MAMYQVSYWSGKEIINLYTNNLVMLINSGRLTNKVYTVSRWNPVGEIYETIYTA